MILVGGCPGRVVPAIGAGHGVMPPSFASDGDYPSPLANDLPALSLRDQAQWLWVLLPPLPGSGTTRADDEGAYALDSPATGDYSQVYRGIVLPTSSAVEVYESTISITVMAAVVDLAGSAEGSSTAAGELHGAADLGGGAQGQASADGDLSVDAGAPGNASLAGAAEGSGTAAGELSLDVPLGGDAGGESSAAADLLSAQPSAARAPVLYSKQGTGGRRAQSLFAIDVHEIDLQPFDFARGMSAGETIVAVASMESEVYLGDDAVPNDVLIGAPVISGTTVLQRIRGSVAGVTYLLRCRVALSTGRELVCAGRLPCVRM